MSFEKNHFQTKKNKKMVFKEIILKKKGFKNKIQFGL